MGNSRHQHVSPLLLPPLSMPSFPSQHPYLPPPEYIEVESGTVTPSTALSNSYSTPYSSVSCPSTPNAYGLSQDSKYKVIF